MKIGIVGLGVVGKAVYDGLNQIGHDMSYHDISHQNSTIHDVIATELVFLCLPTRTIESQCDLSCVNTIMRTMSNLNYSGIIALKSTVLPGTTQNLIESYPELQICCVPEFLRAKSSLSDFVDEHHVLVIGTDEVEIYDKVVQAHGNIPKKSIMISPTEAELVKYFCNTYNALRVVFANCMFDICDCLGADYQNVLRAVIQRPGITASYLRCSNEYRGFGGQCLPKDTEAFESFVQTLDLDPKLFSSIVSLNKKFQ